MRNAFVLCCSVALLGTVGTASAQDWTKSKWGPTDEIGAANYMTPDIVVKAAGLIKTGKTYALGIETNSKTPAYPPRTFKVLVLQPGQAGGNGLGPNKTTYNDDIIEGWVGIGSQIDGLGHIGVDWTYYNGNKSGDFAAADGLKKLGVEGAKYLVSKGVVAIGADTWALEVIPFESKNVFEVHQILLPMSGTYILENMNTAALAADKAYEFLFVLGTPKITGAVQGIINPVAIR